jgi:NADH-quinone oxidoreductase subunit L
MHLHHFSLLFLIPLLPLIGAAYNGLFGAYIQRRFGRKAVFIPAIILPWSSFVIALVAFISLAQQDKNTAIYQHLWEWVNIGVLRVDMAFLMDPLSGVMTLVVTFVGSLIHVYSIAYMKDEPSYWRFFSYLNLFMFAMLVLVLGDNLLLMFVGWEGVGLCSYLLISFWYKKQENAAAGMKAFVVNRIGDFGFTLGIFLLFWSIFIAAPATMLSQSHSQQNKPPLSANTKPKISTHQQPQATTKPAAATIAQAATKPAAATIAQATTKPAAATIAQATTKPAATAIAPVATRKGEGVGTKPVKEALIADGDSGQGDAELQMARAFLARGLLPEAMRTSDTTAISAEMVGSSVAFRDIERLLKDPVRREAFLVQSIWGIGIVTLLCLLLFIGATGKSAQIPLYVWLPDAMAGPTPVSALIHAATMVTAGVYMVARLHFVFALSHTAMTVVAVVGALTALFAATIALFQYDIKKVLAYSTVSQLGFMFVAVGVGAWWVAIFHLMTHAFFKACLFLGSGSVIMGCHHEQDMRKMGGLRKMMPITALTYLVSCAAIAGFPFFSGFFSKEEILWASFNSNVTFIPGGGITIWVIISVAALMTTFYMFRSYYMTFTGEYRGSDNAHAHSEASGGHEAHGHGLPQESPRPITYVLVILGVLALIGGFVGLPHLWHLPNLLEPWLAPVFASSKDLIVKVGHPYSLKWMVLFVATALAFIGFFLARWLYRDAQNKLPQKLLDSYNPITRGLHKLIFNKYYIDELYHATVIKGSIKFASFLAWWDRNVIDGLVNLCAKIGRALSEIQGLIDRYIVDGLVNLVAAVILKSGHKIRQLQTGQLQTYILWLAIGAILLVVITFSLGMMPK